MNDAAWRNRIVGEGEVAAGDLIPHPRNWRKHPQRQASALTQSLSGVGWVQRVIVNQRTGRMLDGHLRAELARKQGKDTPVPVVYVDLSEDEEKAVLATLDPIAALAEADADVLADLVQSIDDDILRSIVDVVQPTDKVQRQGDTAPQIDRAEELRQKWGVEPGQLWQLGEHRLICGDCTDAAVVARVMGGETADFMLTDPPYCSGGFQESGRSSGSVGTTAVHKKIEADTLSTRGYIALMKAMLSASRVLAAYIFTDWRMWVNLFDAVESSGFGVRQMIVWDKGTPGMGHGWRAQHELLMFALKGTIAFDKFSHAQGNVIQSKRTGNELHTTQKPTDLIERVLVVMETMFTVYDPFSGSGTTLIACENLGRRCRAVEIAPGYVAVALERWATHTGKTPVLLAD